MHPAGEETQQSNRREGLTPGVHEVAKARADRLLARERGGMELDALAPLVGARLQARLVDLRLALQLAARIDAHEDFAGARLRPWEIVGDRGILWDIVGDHGRSSSDIVGYRGRSWEIFIGARLDELADAVAHAADPVALVHIARGAVVVAAVTLHLVIHPLALVLVALGA